MDPVRSGPKRTPGVGDSVIKLRRLVPLRTHRLNHSGLKFRTEAPLRLVESMNWETLGQRSGYVVLRVPFNCLTIHIRVDGN